MTTLKTINLDTSKRSEPQINEAAQLSQNLKGLSCLEMSHAEDDILEEKPNFGQGFEKDKSVTINVLDLSPFSGFMSVIHAPEKCKQKLQSFTKTDLIELSQSLLEMLPPMLEEACRLRNEIEQKELKFQQKELKFQEEACLNMEKLQEVENQFNFCVQEARENMLNIAEETFRAYDKKWVK